MYGKRCMLGDCDDDPTTQVNLQPLTPSTVNLLYPPPPLTPLTVPPTTNSRFIALGELATGSAVPKDKTKKWVHALNLEPIAFMKKEELSKRSADTTDCPYVARKVLGGAGGGGRGSGGGIGGGAQVCVCFVSVDVRMKRGVCVCVREYEKRRVCENKKEACLCEIEERRVYVKIK